MKRGSIVMFRPGLAHEPDPAHEPDDDRQVGLVTSLSIADDFSHRGGVRQHQLRGYYGPAADGR